MRPLVRCSTAVLQHLMPCAYQRGNVYPAPHQCVQRNIYPQPNSVSRSVDAIPLGIPGMPDEVASEVGIQPSSRQEGEGAMSAGGTTWKSPRRISTGGMQRQALVGALVLGALYCTQSWEGELPHAHHCPLLPRVVVKHF